MEGNKINKTTKDDIVISGLSLRLPECDNADEFWENLVSGVDMVTEDDRRWPPGLYGLPKKNGKLKRLDTFDSTFFGVHPKQAESMDPQLRILLEVAYECIVDSGYGQHELSGSETGVFIGSTFSDAHDLMSSGQAGELTGYEMTGSNRAMLANRLSYVYNLKGPSLTVDTACSSGLEALCLAVSAIREGRCQSALVGGVNLLLKPETSLQFHKLNMLSPDGQCKSFDESANGYCRSEGIVVLHIEKRQTCRRHYMTIKAIKDNVDGYKPEGISFPLGAAQKSLLTDVYKLADVSPSDVSYIEAHGTGTQAGDPVELNTIDEVFCGGERAGPLLVGSVKSNIGHCEAASGLASVVKVILANQHQLIPANLHFRNPNPKIPALLNNKLKVVSENTSWNGGLIAVNSFGFGGANVHMVLESPQTEVNNNDGSSHREIPHLLFTSARTKSGVEKLLQNYPQQQGGLDYMALLHSGTKQGNSSKTLLFKGFSVPEKGVMEVAETDPSQIKEAEAKRPLWFIYPGMGCQWVGMGRDMMKIPQFREVIMSCHQVLLKEGLDLVHILEGDDAAVLKDPLNSFVAICSIQIALTVMLKGLGLAPDGIIGHSVGELGCAFADDTLTIEQTILAAYWRGKCVKDAHMPPGAMAAVGMTWEEAKEKCPEGIVPACHNATGTVTISGPKEQVTSFVADLKAADVFAREVDSSGIAFHSYFMQQCGEALLSCLKQVIPHPKPRSRKWISTSVPASKKPERSDDMNRMSSAEYHVNNLLSPVLFQEGLQYVPQNAILIEIGPHGLLQALLKRELGPDPVFLSTMKKNEDNVKFLLSMIGRCYIHGVVPDLEYLYGSYRYPVNPDLPPLSPCVQWQHQQQWNVPHYSKSHSGNNQGLKVVKIDPTNEQHRYISDHVIDGRALYPMAGYIVLAWQAFAERRGKEMDEVCVVIRDLRIHEATIVGEDTIDHTIQLSENSGAFEISVDHNMKCTGTIETAKLKKLPMRNPPRVNSSCDSAAEILLSHDDIYKQLRLRGYEYGESFQNIVSYDLKGRCGVIQGVTNWVTYIDTMLHVVLLEQEGDRSLKLPTSLKQITVCPDEQGVPTSQTKIDVTYQPHSDEIVTSHVKIKALDLVTTQRRADKKKPILCSYKFLPYHSSRNILDDDSERKCATTPCTLPVKTKPTSGYSQNNNNNPCPAIDVRTRSHLTGGEQQQSSNGLFMQYLQSLENNNNEDADNESNKEIYSKNNQLLNALDICLENSTSSNRVNVGFVIHTETGMQVIQNMIDIIWCFPYVQFNMWAFCKGSRELSEKLQKIHGSNVDICSAGDLSEEIKNTDVLLTDMTESNGLLASLKEKTFVVIISSGLDDSILNDGYEDFHQVAKVCSSGDCDALLVRRRKENEKKIVAEVVVARDDGYSWVEDLKLKLVSAEQASDCEKRVWVAAPAGKAHGVIGMVNCLLHEPGGDKIRCVVNGSPDEELVQRDCVMNVYKAEVYGSYRRCLLDTDQIVQHVQDAYLDILTKGDLSTLSWIEMPRSDWTVKTKSSGGGGAPGSGGARSKSGAIAGEGAEIDGAEETINVTHAALNFRDVMVATGRLTVDALPNSGETVLGLEFAGYNTRGQRKMGISMGKSIATRVRTPVRNTWVIPESWSLPEASTVPIAYVTAYYTLVVRAGITAGKTVLIHSAGSAVGQAAIAVAQACGCTVFVTAGTETKRSYLRERYNIEERCVSNSRSLEFVDDFMEATCGKGLDVILNPLSDEKLKSSLEILAESGQFLEIGKYDLANDTKLGMSLFLKNISFHGVQIETILEADNSDWMRVHDLVSNGITTGVVQPLKATVFQNHEAEQAFRHMAEGNHMGKVILQIHKKHILSNPVVSGFGAQKPTMKAIRRVYFHPEKVYIITGGLGGLGMEMANWMVYRGARKLVLTSRKGITSGYQKRLIHTWKRKCSVSVLVSRYDVAQREQTETLLSEACTLGALGGIFHLAAVLHDGLFSTQTAETFEKVTQIKTVGIDNLDQLTRSPEYGSQLDYFVAFSSAASGYGNAGQANYGYANSYMERVCEARVELGLPGKAIQWGFIGDVGIVQDTLAGNNLYHMGMIPQRIPSFLSTLELFLLSPGAVYSSILPAGKQGVRKGSLRGESQAGGGGGSSPTDMAVQAVMNIIGLKDPASINSSTPLLEIGLDSLMATEIRQVLGRKYDLNLSMPEVQNLTIGKLRQMKI